MWAAAFERRARDVTAARTSADVAAGLPAESPRVTMHSALTITAVYACVRLLADSVATLPIDVYRRTADGGRRELSTRPPWIEQPNPDTDRLTWLSQVMTSLLLAGNAYIAVSWAGADIAALDVLDPRRITPRYERTRAGTKTLVYQVSSAGSQARREVIGTLTPREVVHLRGMTLPGELEGVSPVRAARETIGLAMSAQEFGARFFTEGAVPQVALEVPGAMSPEGIAAAQAHWRKTFGGARKRHNPAVLIEGVKLKTISIAPDEAQFLQTRQFQVADIARLFGVPPHLIGDASGSTSWGSGLAEQGLAFVMYSLRPWLERIETGFDRLIQLQYGRRRAFTKFNAEGLLRGSAKDRMEIYRQGIQSGIYTPAEVRALEDLPPLDNDYAGYPQVPMSQALLTPAGPVPTNQPPGARSAVEEDQDREDRAT
ncbi:histone H1 [Longimycelium tulufanense]|uniref:Histone H1 n=1 Tax=Longimycelium tulufanense TaxID=907463 RepID=A0A8J3FTR2_9PSEU|nr:phage portal protein [Longimycelium tulufanense]GGM48503.1 histone H1 [Longimycelium tulufanense]